MSRTKIQRIMNREQHIEELITLYSLGLLEGNELREVEEILRSKDAKYLKYFEDINTVYTQLVYSLEDKPLSPEIKDKIFSKISSHAKAGFEEKKLGLFDLLNFFWFKFGAAAACIVIGFLLYSNIEIKNELAKKSEQIDLLLSEMEHDKMLKSFIENPSVNVVKLASYESDMNMHARLLWDKDKNSALLCILDMPAIGEDKTYQFWTDSESEMESMGTFGYIGQIKDMPMADKMMMINDMPRHSKTMTFYVSIEPKGGMPHPTGKKYLIGKL
ncbi:MAG: anti-sigma factor domain-containing protein [Thermodesulfobacteriota bacterium]